ncbi:MAG: sigma factor, partial [Chloroflexota bacterium]
MHKTNEVLPGQLSDEMLVAQIAQGNADALETLYGRYAPIVLGLCLRIVADHAAAEDVLQETFWRVWKSAAAYQLHKGPFTGWLFRI